jgi:hypothetical protein
MMPMRVFVSYSRHDSDFVARLVAVLEANRHDVWLDATDLRGSDEWRQSIVDAIRAADVVVLVISPRSMASTDVEREITVAAEEQRRILPVVLEHADLTGSIRYELAGVQHISFEGQPFDDAASKLLEAIQAPSATTSRSPTETTSPGSLPVRLRSLGGRAASLGALAAAVLGLLILRLALGSGDGPGPAASGQPEQPTTAASSATAVDLDAAVWFSGFDIKVDRALYDREHRKVRVDTAFTNRQPANADPGHILGWDTTALEWNGRRFGPSCMCNSLPVSAKLDTTLTFDVDDGFDLADAVLVFGAPTQHQAKIPLSGERATSEMPVSRDVSSPIPDGAGSTFTVEKIDVVPASCTGLSDRLNYLPGPAGKLSIVVFGTAETTRQNGAGFGEAYLVLPDGSRSGSNSMTGGLAVYPDRPFHDAAACMTVPAPAAGTYRFVVTADDVKSKPWGLEFEL